jgi:hypothetical protein
MSSSTGSNYVGLPHTGAWLVYLNGVEVPCPSVSVNYGVWSIPEATLTFPPHRLLQRLGTEDRIEVVIFYLDDLDDPEHPEFRLLFEGEIIGWSYASSPDGRQMAFNAVADISVFTQLHFFFLNNVDAIADYTVTPGAGAAGIGQAGAFYPFSLFKKGLLVQANEKGKDSSPPDITRPFEILYNVVRGMIDTRLNDQKPSRRSIPAVNFFSRWTRKRNFLNRFAALPIFEDEVADSTAGVFPIIQAAQATTALKTMQDNLASTIGNAGTLWEVLKETYGHVFFEIAMLPTAPAARVRIEDGTIVGGPTPGVGQTNKRTEPVRLLNYFVKPQLFFGIAPTCNVMFPSMISNYTYSESYIAQPTRTYVNDQFIASALSQNVFTAAALSFGYPEEVDVILADKTGRAQAAAAKANAGNAAGSRRVSFSGKNLLVFPEEFYKGPVLSRMSVPAWFTYLKNREPKTSTSVAEQPTPASKDEAASLHALMSSYVEYEHFRGRYEKRGGAVNMAWNPYVVPGFPCVIFDQKASAFHTLGYLSNVVQSMSMEGMYTAINYSLSRTIPEMFDLLKSDLAKPENKNKIFGSAPLEPITPVRDIIQDFTRAEQFYNALFFQRQPMKNGKKASFDFREVLGYSRTDGKVDPIKLSVETQGVASTAVASANVATTFSGGASTNVNASANSSTVGAGQTTVNNVTLNTGVTIGGVVSQPVTTNNLTGTRDVVALPAFQAVFSQYDTAMQYVARPICSITDYLTFLHGAESSLELLRQEGQIAPGDARFGKDIVYFKRIKKLTYDPAYRPSAAEVGVKTAEDGTVSAYEDAPIGAENASQTRADWDSALVAYQIEMYSRQGPHE